MNATSLYQSAVSDGSTKLLLRGILAILFGLGTIFMPQVTLLTFVALFAIYAVTDGFIAIWAGFSSRKANEDWWLQVLWGILGIIVGCITFTSPNVTALSLIYFVGVWCLVGGGMQIAAGFQLRKAISGEWLLILSGILSILLGILLFVQPATGALSMLVVVGIYAVILGIFLIVLSFKVKKLA